MNKERIILLIVHYIRCIIVEKGFICLLNNMFPFTCHIPVMLLPVPVYITYTESLYSFLCT